MDTVWNMSPSFRDLPILTADSPVLMDHCYAKPWNWRQEMAHCKPLRTLFSEEKIQTSIIANEILDVESYSVPKTVNVLDNETTLRNFVESELKLSHLSAEDNPVEWEETVKRDGWTPLQHRLFNKVVKLLVADSMARLATCQIDHEPIQKKIHSEGSAKRLRIILSSVSWDLKITQWLHLTLIEHLNRDYLMGYIGILQVLRSKVPTLVDRMLNTSAGKLSSLNTQIMNYIINRPWEPALVSVPTVNRIPITPFIIMVPSGTCNFNTSSRSLSGSRRFQTWHNLLQTVGRVLTVNLHNMSSPHTLPLPMYVEAIINATIQRVQELKANCPGRPIILAGLQQGSLIAAQVAYIEQVTGIICLGFPLFCVDGKRGDPDDFILDIKAPTLIVIGSSSSTCTIDGMEQLRHRMKAESSLLVVDGAMDSLRMLKCKKKQLNVTQSMVDACILEEVSTFLGMILSPATVSSDKRGLHSPADRKTPDCAPMGLKRLRQYNDADDSPHPALSGHDYSQSTPFAQPFKGRGGTGLRVRGGRVGPGHSRTPYQRALSDAATYSTPKGRVARSISTGSHRGLFGGIENSPRLIINRVVIPPHLHNDGESDYKSVSSSAQGSPKEESPRPHFDECKGGDSSETESAPPADDDEDVLEDLRFASELLNKLQPSKREDLAPESSDNSLQPSGDEGDYY